MTEHHNSATFHREVSHRCRSNLSRSRAKSLEQRPPAGATWESRRGAGQVEARSPESHAPSAGPAIAPRRSLPASRLRAAPPLPAPRSMGPADRRSRALRADRRARARRPRSGRARGRQAARPHGRGEGAAAPGATRHEARFVREALITARLEHPGIVPVHEAGRWPNGDPYYVMKLVEGRTLKELIAERAHAARAARPVAARDRDRRCRRLRAQRGRDPPRPQAVERDRRRVRRDDRRRLGPRARSQAATCPSRRRRLGARDRARASRRSRARSSARPRTWRPSRRAASSSTSAPMSTRSAPCSTSCSPARRRTPTPRRRPRSTA